MTLVVIIAAIVVMPTRVLAMGQVVYPTLDRGSEGEDVYALQYLLRYCGYSLGIDGDFGPGTESAVKAFQSSRGLSADGVVGPATWSKLVATVWWESYGDHVRAVQRLLRYKVGYTNVSINGNGNDSATKQRIRDFQAHMGLTVDGVVGPTTWKYLLWHYDKVTPTSYLCYGASNGSTSMVDPWGTAETKRSIEMAAYSFSIQNAGKLPMRDVSLEHGGDISGHHSHEVGLDVDVRTIQRDRGQCVHGNVYYTSSDYDYYKTLELIYDIRLRADYGQHLKVIFFNDPYIYRKLSYVEYWPGHDEHLHVRYCQVYYPYDSRYDC